MYIPNKTKNTENKTHYKLFTLFMLSFMIIGFMPIEAENTQAFVLRDFLTNSGSLIYPFSQTVFQCNPDIIGDFNNDSLVDINDSLIIAHASANASVSVMGSVQGVLCTSTLDMNNDNMVTLEDAKLLQIFITFGLPQCMDNADNDNDTFKDLFDPECMATHFTHTNEGSTTPLPFVPQVTIASPASGSRFDSGTQVQFIAQTFDQDEPGFVISDTNISWESNLDGILGTGHSLFFTLSNGNHTVTVTATDSTGLVGTDQINVEIADQVVLPPHVSTSQITITDALLGGPNQARADDIRGQFTITNTGTETLHNIVISNTADAEFDILLDNGTIPLTLVQGEQAVVSFTGDMPFGFDATNSACEEVAFDIGMFEVTAMNSTGQIMASSTIRMQRENYLHIDELTLLLNGDEEDIDNNDDVEVKQGDRFTLRANVEHIGSRNIDAEDITIEDIEGEFVPDDNDIDEEDVDFSDMDAGDDETESVNVNVDYDVDEDEIDAVFRVEGFATDDGSSSSDSRSRMCDKIDFTLELEGEDDEVIIRSASANNPAPQCGDRVQFSFDLQNIGKDDQDDVYVEIDNAKLNIYERAGPETLDEDDRERVQESFTLPRNLEPGAYEFDVRVIVDNGDVTDEETLVLQVRCDEGTSSSSPTGASTSGSNTFSQQTLNGASGNNPVLEGNLVYAEPTSVEETSFRASNLYIPFLVLFILVILLVILFLVKLIRR